MLPQDAHFCVKQLHKKLHKRLGPQACQALAASDSPVNLASPASIKRFAAAVNALPGPLDLLVLDVAEGFAASSRRRWYTPEGIAGHTQVRPALG